MLVCNVSLRPPRAAIVADLVEAIEAVDATATGQVVFATLVDDPAAVIDAVDAYLGEVMVEAASATETMTAGSLFDAAVAEAVTAADTQDGTATSAPVGPPSILTGLKGWWDASVFSSFTFSTGVNITSVADQSGAGNNLSSTITPPTYNATGLNSLPTITFAGTGGLFKSSFAFGTGNTLTVFAVVIMGSSSGAYARIISYFGGGSNDANNNTSFLVSRDNTTNAIVLYRNANIASRAVTTGVPVRVIATVSSSGVETIYINGVATTGATLNAAFGASGTLAIGMTAHDNLSNWIGQISEIGVATGYSDATAAAALDTYLKNKWGL